MMNKTELFSIYQKHSSADEAVWDSWFEWRLKLIGCPRHVDKDSQGYDEWHTKWLELLHTMPNHFDWRPTADDKIVVSFGNDEEETFPLELVVGGLEDEPDVTMLWHCGYWDGPLSGMADIKGEHVWFECTDGDVDDRVFALYRLSDENKKELIRRHELFQHHVGYHCDHDPNVYQEFAGGHDPDKYYKLQKKFTKIKASEGEELLTVHWFQFENWIRPK